MRSDAKHSASKGLAQRRSRVVRMMPVEQPMKMMTHGWQCSRSMVSEKMRVTEQRKRLRTRLDSQSFEGITQLPSWLFDRS